MRPANTRASAHASLRADRRGGIAIFFALALAALCILIAAAIDLNRQMTARMTLQHALDAAALAAGRHRIDNPSISQVALKTYARAFMDGQLPVERGIVVNSFDLVIDTSENDLDLTAAGEIDASLGQLAGIEQLGIRARTSSLFSTPEPLEIALVLDMSYSMTGSRLTNLKSAATSLARSLMSNEGAVKLGVVPFNSYVNVGTSHRNDPWITVPPDESGTWSSCWPSEASYIAAGCTRSSSTCYNDGVPYTCWPMSCPPGATPVKDVCSSGTWSKTWYGCVASRSHPRNIRDIDYALETVKGVLGDWNFCPRALTPLTDNQTTAEAAISALSASGETYVATGLSWGYRILTSNAPFAEGTDEADFAADNGRKAVVLMSDGENTKSPDGTSSHNGSNRVLADSYTAEMCEEIKDAGFELYVVAYEVTDAGTLDLLQECAMADGFYSADSADELQAAFASITASLQKLRLSK